MMFEELDYRENDALQVALVCSRKDNRLVVRVVDTKTDDVFELTVLPHEALDAFRHPFAYAAYREEQGPQEDQSGERFARNARRPS
jgi:hypothetical protein